MVSVMVPPSASEARTRADGLLLVIYYAEPGSRSADALAILGSLSVSG
jgi:hypothetical protein